ITNTRAATGQLTLQKRWARGAPGDTAALSATGGQDDGTATAVVPPAGTGTSSDKVVVPIAAGDSVDLTGALAGDTGTYPSALSCDHPGLPAGGDGRSGTFLAPAGVGSVVCTFTNVRTSARLTLRKTWVDGAGGDTTDLSTSGA